MYGEKLGGQLAHGMTLRDYFAAKAMQAYLTHKIIADMADVIVAEWAYSTADAMLKARQA
jgi:hypothetical protein